MGGVKYRLALSAATAGDPKVALAKVETNGTQKRKEKRLIV